MASCFGCLHQQVGGVNFLGVCTYFEKLGKEKKEIPERVVDVGCKHYAGRGDASEWLKHAPANT